MSDPIRVLLERGRRRPVGVAIALDWPGWERGVKSTDEDAALAVLDTYRSRYAPVAELAGLGKEFRQAGSLEITERIEGVGMTDFYRLSYKSAPSEHEPLSDEACERLIGLLQASWTYFDQTAARVSKQLAKGPRGGGREHDEIVRHVNAVEVQDFSRKVGVQAPDDAWTTPASRKEYRAEYVDAIRDHNIRGAQARTWTIPFLIRHSAYHMLDHAWELEDRGSGLETTNPATRHRSIH